MQWRKRNQIYEKSLEAKALSKRQTSKGNFITFKWFLPCGAGRRICPGLMFKLSDIELTLASLLYHSSWRLPTRSYSNKLDMTEANEITTHRRIDICLEATPFVPRG
uniref:Cytochrome P450 n=1 Tax=Oryza meridionalis TaxID=40149 RepID=A0A0E0CD61_9ORYZ